MGVREGPRESRVPTDCPAHLQPEGAFRVSGTLTIVLSLGFVRQILAYRIRLHQQRERPNSQQTSLAIFVTQEERLDGDVSVR